MNEVMNINHSGARFSLGRLVATPGALRFLEQSGLSSCQLLAATRLATGAKWTPRKAMQPFRVRS